MFAWEIALPFGVGLLLLYFVSKLLIVPSRLLWRLMSNALLGGGLLWLFNLVGVYLGIPLIINPFTALLAGTLGVPGVALLVMVTHFL